MQRIRPLLLLMLLGCFVGPALGQPLWNKFTPPAAGVTVDFPAAPTPTVTDASSFVGKISIRAWTCHADRCRYRFSITDVPGVALSLAPGQVFNACRDGLLRETSGSKVSFGLLSFGDYRARELLYTIRLNGQPAKNGRAWFVLIGRHMLMLDAHGPAPEYESEARRFFSSLSSS